MAMHAQSGRTAKTHSLSVATTIMGVSECGAVGRKEQLAFVAAIVFPLSLYLCLLTRHDTNEWPLRWRSGDRDHRVIGTLLFGGLKWSTEGGSEETDSSPICSLLWSRSERAVVFCFIRRKRKRRKMDPFLRHHFVRNPVGLRPS